MAFNWNNLFQAIALYFTFKKGQEDKGDVVVPIPPTPKPKPVPKPVPTPSPTPVPTPEPPQEDGIIDCHYKDIIHHYNPRSLEDKSYPKGRGVSIIFCVRDKYESVIFDGQKFRCQNDNDEGREWWTNIDFKGQQPVNMSGVVLAKNKNGKTYRFTIPAGGKSYLDYKGNCFGRR